MCYSALPQLPPADLLGHGDEHAHRSTLPPDATAGEVKKMDAEGLAVFEGKEVRHECLVKINQLAL
jgi:hypothetical protein